MKTSGLYHVLKLSNLNHVFKMLLNFRFIKKHLLRKVLVLVRLNIVFLVMSSQEGSIGIVSL